MRSGTYPHPTDEFDAVARAGGPRGVHRTPRTRWSRWWPFLVVLVVFPALAFGIVTALSQWDGLGGWQDSLAGDSAETEDESTDDTGGSTDSPTTAAPETPEVTPTPTPEPPPADLTRPVEVLNATNTSGLARNGGDRLETAGFTAVDVGDWSGTDPAASVVYYGTPGDVTTAQQAAATLGIVTVTESLELAPAGIVVVLADDYQAT